MHLLNVMHSGFFVCPFFLQDPNKLLTSFASLHIRKVIYGILFKEHPEGKPHKIYVHGKTFISSFSLICA